jgi:hypothetical protein
MRAHVIENGIVTNTIEVESLDFLLNLVSGESGCIGDIYENGQFIKPPINTESLAVDIRSERDVLLASTDWTQVIDAPVDQAAWATYRQTLRDLPQQVGFPTAIVWPVKP